MHAIDSAAHVDPVYDALCWTLTSAPAEGPSSVRVSVGVIPAAYVVYGCDSCSLCGSALSKCCDPWPNLCSDPGNQCGVPPIMHLDNSVICPFMQSSLNSFFHALFPAFLPMLMINNAGASVSSMMGKECMNEGSFKWGFVYLLNGVLVYLFNGVLCTSRIGFQQECGACRLQVQQPGLSSSCKLSQVMHGS